MVVQIPPHTPKPKCVLIPRKKYQKEVLQSRAVFGEICCTGKCVVLVFKKELQSCLDASIYS